MGRKKIRTVPFGAPTSTDTEPHNPGRFMYASRQSTSYSAGAAITDAFKFVVLTGRNGGGVSEDPYYVDYSMSDADKVWASGPFDNSATFEHAVENCGYWTNSTGPNSDKPPSNYITDVFGFQMFTVNKNLKMIYNMGHGAAASSAEGGEYGCVGIAGHWRADNDEVSNGTSPSVGIKKVYIMYRMDASDEYLTELEEALEGISFSSFTFDPQKSGHVEVAKLLGEKLGSGDLVQRLLTRNELTGDLLTDTMGTASTILKVIKYANKIWQGLKDRKEVDWIAECTVDGQYNEVTRNKYHYPDLKVRDWYHFCYHLNSDFRQITQLMRCRFNGWLWHVSCKEANGIVGKTRIMRFKNVVPLYSSTYEKFGNTKYRKVLRHYDPSGSSDKGFNFDKSIQLDTRE